MKFPSAPFRIISITKSLSLTTVSSKNEWTDILRSGCSVAVSQCWVYRFGECTRCTRPARYRFAHPFQSWAGPDFSWNEPCLPTTSSAPSSTGDSKSMTIWRRARRWSRSIRSSTSTRNFTSSPGRRSNNTKPLLTSEALLMLRLWEYCHNSSNFKIERFFRCWRSRDLTFTGIVLMFRVTVEGSLIDFQLLKFECNLRLMNVKDAFSVCM